MFTLFQKKQSIDGATVTFIIDGMHCTSCSLNINGELEDTKGVLSADTSYAQSKTVIRFDAHLVSVQQLQKIIEKLGYKVCLRTPLNV